MKFTPDHRPITMTGVASLAGLAVIAVLFFFTSSLITVPRAPLAAVRDAHADSTVTRGPAGAPRDSVAAADPASVMNLPGLTESVRASLLAAIGAVPHGWPDSGGRDRPPAGGVQPGGPIAQTHQGPGHAVPGAGPSHVVPPPKRPAGTVTMGSISWIGGGRRKKVSGALPAWPSGVTADAHIKVEAVVAPDGRVRSVRPGQKGNARCEDAAVRAVQHWRFERLARHMPQRDQRCVVTFSFSVR